jgi:hypothetical protein
MTVLYCQLSQYCKNNQPKGCFFYMTRERLYKGGWWVRYVGCPMPIELIFDNIIERGS